MRKKKRKRILGYYTELYAEILSIGALHTIITFARATIMKSPKHALALLLSILCASFLSAADLPDRHPLDESEYRRFILDNGLKVLLLSDPALNKSSASMAVGVGSLDDPKDRPGLAHFLEHMLFLGTEKYPEVEEYGNYLRSNGGYSNAYTSGDLTNYHFEVSHEAFPGALDRFAQFFIAPLFSAEFTEREMNAVHSEHQKNLENDAWRSYQLMRIHYNNDHPANHFSTGNLETLGNVKREDLLAFYEQYYSANQMTLAITGSASLDKMEALARDLFSAIANYKLSKIKYPKDFLDPKSAFRLIQVEPIQDIRELTMIFPLPALQKHYESKPGELLGFILGYEGKGSLLSYLKKKEYATALGASASDNTADYGTFTVSIDLTPKGLENYRDVVSLFFSYIKDMKTTGYPEALFDERATMARLSELYSDKGEGAGRAVSLANRLRSYPMDIAEREPYIYTKKDPTIFKQLIKQLRPNNMLVQLIAKGLKTDKVEHFYGAKYSYTEEEGKFFKSLAYPHDITELHIPKDNPYIPSTVSLLPDIPTKLVDAPGVSLFYLKDATFQRPKVTLIYDIIQAHDDVNLQSSVLKDVYSTCINEVINEVGYTAAMAGLSYSFSADKGSVSIVVSGYNESALKLFKTIVDTMIAFELSEERFEAIKDMIVRELENFPKNDAWKIARERKRKIANEFYYLPKEQLPLLKATTLKDIFRYAKRLYRSGAIEGLVHGNMTQAEALQSLNYLKDTLRIRALDRSDAYEPRILVQNPGGRVIHTDKLEVNNSCFWREYFLGYDTPENRVASLVFGNFMSNPFYAEMRTRQQLGYIVWGQTARSEEQLMAYFIIQSSEYPPDELQKRVVAFLTTLPELFAKIPDEQFAQIIAGVRAELEEKEKSIAEKAGTLFDLAYEEDEDWGRDQTSLKALDAITREDVQALIKNIVTQSQQRTKTILLVGREHELGTVVKSTFKNANTWKSEQRYE